MTWAINRNSGRHLIQKIFNFYCQALQASHARKWACGRWALCWFASLVSPRSLSASLCVARSSVPGIP